MSDRDTHNGHPTVLAPVNGNQAARSQAPSVPTTSVPTETPLLTRWWKRAAVAADDWHSAKTLEFSHPSDLPEDHAKLVNDIVVLDHRSLHGLGKGSPQRAEVKALLRNAVVRAGYILDDEPEHEPKLRPVGPAAALVQQAEKIFSRHLEARNRGLYLAGVLIGIVCLIVLGLLTAELAEIIGEAITGRMLPGLIFFAGLGTIVSVLLRLTNLEMGEIDWKILMVSGGGRPFVASAFALVIYLMIENGMVTISLVGGNQESPGSYLVVAFLCGFSERFAQDILGRVGNGLSKDGKPNGAG